MDYSQFLILKEELSLIAVIVILFVADLFMSPDAHKKDGNPRLNTMLPVVLLTIHTLITIIPGLPMLSVVCTITPRYKAS
jgi:NADH-quinone oxidoreductase subunit N